MIRRHLLGLIALGLVAAGCGLLWAGPAAEDYYMYASICIRAGAVLGATWLAFPQLLTLGAKGPPWLLISVVVCSLILVARPRAIVVIGPLLALLGVLQLLGWLLRPPGKPYNQRR